MTSDTETYQSISFDPSAYIADRSATDSTFKAAYEGLEDEYSTLDLLLRTRKEAGISQVDLAARMGIKASSLARIESSIITRKHTPSLTTLRKYAHACGKRLTVQFA